MSTLLIDAGNTRVKFGWREDGAYPGQAAPRAALQTAFRHEELAQALPQWLQAAGLRPHRALGSNVAGPHAEQVIAGVLEAIGCPVQWVRASRRLLGVSNGYRHPERLGADRWLSLVGVWNGWRRQAAPGAHAPVHVVAHFGTATTVDTLDTSGRFIGGLILPGRELMRRSLATGTAGLPRASGRIAPFPDNTDDAIMSGIAAAQAGAVVRQWLAARERYRQEPVLVASGGAWTAIGDEVGQLMQASGSTRPVQVVDNPVLDGLACLAEPDSLPASP
ncbi:MAG: type III pantothenate kinase [Pigmentiphaga sp.]|uniref:type III pantothenate kinase n=1 Tax=Pigmentiphaga sp. TaxID=1977564 RepID=UPI0029B5D7D7|nr:type III pantothenate kinase [Pigmentiphaga sp.]MDX3906865.1 type III pantothenate kinase [Pigmentiphaga sp.]